MVLAVPADMQMAAVVEPVGMDLSIVLGAEVAVLLGAPQPQELREHMDKVAAVAADQP